jgi:hypothetical protein
MGNDPCVPHGGTARRAREQCAEDTVPRSMHAGRNHLAQFLNRRLKSLLLPFISLISLRHPRQLALESLKPRYGFNYEGYACGWGNAGHEMPHWYWSFGEMTISLMAQNYSVNGSLVGMAIRCIDWRVEDLAL